MALTGFSDTFAGYFLVRSNLHSRSDVDVKRSVAYAKRVKFFPLSKIENPPPMVFLDIKDEDFDSTIKYDLSFFRLWWGRQLPANHARLELPCSAFIDRVPRS